MDRAKMFREAAERHNEGRSRHGWRYPPALRALALEYYETLGGGVATAAEALGISPLSLTTWLQGPAPPASLSLPDRESPLTLLPTPDCESAVYRERTDSPSAPMMLPVQVCDAQERAVPLEQRPQALRVVTPRGLCIEGLDWACVLDLVETFG
jgi:hypothetical protein